MTERVFWRIYSIETIKNIPLENVFFPSTNRIEIERINVFIK